MAANLNDRFDFLFVDPGPMDVLPVVKAAEPKLTDGHIIALHNLDFAGSYRSILDYARSKGWMIRELRPQEGYGFFLISPRPFDLDGDQVRFDLHGPSGRLER